MATKNQSDVSLLGTMVASGAYKRTQGRLARQLTLMGLLGLVLLGCYTLSVGPLAGYQPVYRLGIPAAVALVGAWASYRLINYPRFADFLVSVEAEMAKVSWPSRGELYRATVVVIVTMLLLAIILFVFDYFWQFVFQLIGVIHTAPPK